MKPKTLYKIANFSGWALLVMLILYFISGYAMLHKYGMTYLMNNTQAIFWHKYLTIPFFIFLILHIVPYYMVKKQLKRLAVITFIIFAIPAVSVYAINEFVPEKTSQSQKAKAVKCKNCPRECIIQPGEKGACGQYENVDGKLKPVKD